MRLVRSTGSLLALVVVGLVLIGFSFSLPSEPVTTCLTNLYGYFCTVHYLEEDRVISCGLRPGGGPVSCIQSQWWINPIPFLYFKSMEARIVGIVVLLSGIVGYALLVFISFDSHSGVKSQRSCPSAISRLSCS